MKFRYVGNKCTPRESTKEYTEKKLSKLNRFFSGDCTADVVYTLEKGDRFKVEVTVIYEGIIFRAQSVTDDFMHSIDEVVDLLVRQIRKHKTKLQKRIKNSDFAFEGYEESSNAQEDDGLVIKRKQISVKPMSCEEAILQMNMLGHDFFVFRNEDGNMNVVYCRKDGNYGLIETN